MPQKFNTQALAWMRLAHQLAAHHGHKEIEPDHLYAVILNDPFCSSLWEQKPHLKQPLISAIDSMVKALGTDNVRFEKPVSSDRLNRVLALASASLPSADTPIQPELLFRSLITEAPIAAFGEAPVALQNYSSLKMMTAPGLLSRLATIKQLDFSPPQKGISLQQDFNTEEENQSEELPGLLSNRSKRKAGRLRQVLNESVYGQDHAFEDIENVMLISTQGFERENKTAATIFFHGPTGVGKTQTAKCIAEHFDIPLLRYDMGEYQEMHSISRLIGSPPGYVGHDNGGQLIRDVNDAGFCVVLIDEAEKAHFSIDNFLLGIMDHGYATDGSGVKANFGEVILFITANIGAQEAARNRIGFGDDKSQSAERADQAFKRRYSPEFRNRLDVVAQLRDVRATVMPSIIDKFIAEFSEEMEDRSLSATFTEAARNHLIAKGMDSEFGPRDARRAIEKGVKAQIARALNDMDDTENFTVDYDSTQNKLVVAKHEMAFH